MKISASAIIERMMKRLAMRRFHDDFEFFEHSVNVEKPNNIEKIFGETFVDVDIHKFDELNEFLKTKKQSNYLEKSIMRYKHLVEFYRFIGEKNGVAKDIWIKDYRIEDTKSLGYLNSLIKKSINNYIIRNGENFRNEADEVQNLVRMANDVEAAFVGILDQSDLLAHKLLLAQPALYFFENQNDILIETLKGLDEQNDEVKLWLQLFYNLRNALNQAKFVYGLAYVLEKAGVEVESVKDGLTKLFQLIQLKVVEIIAVEKHPKADKLNLCTIFDGVENKQVVCGGENVNHIFNHKLRTVYVNVGQIIPNGTVLEPREIRGIVSNGMLCSTEELMIDFPKDEAVGIAELDANATVGDSPVAYLFEKFNLSTIFDISITPNLDKAIGILSLESLILSYIMHDKYDVLSSAGNYLNEMREGEHNGFEINQDFIENTVQSVVDNVFFYQIKDVSIHVPANYDAKALLHSHDFEVQNNVMDIVNSQNILLGAVPHVIDMDKVRGKLRIIESDRTRDGLEIGDIVLVDGEDNLIAVPGLYDVKEYTFDAKTSKSIALLYIVFAENPKRETDVGFNKMLGIARRNRLSNKMIYFYERGRIDESYLKHSLSATRMDDSLIENFAFSCINKEVNKEEYWFKKITINLADVLTMFKKNGVLSQIDDEFYKSEPHLKPNNIGQVLFYVAVILTHLRIIDERTLANSEHALENFFSQINHTGDSIILQVFKHYSNLNSSLDVIAEIVKYIDFETNQKAIRGGAYPLFFRQPNDSDDMENKKSITAQEQKSYFDFERYYNEKINSSEYGEYGLMKLERKLKKTLVNCGFAEVCNFSFVNKEDANLDGEYLVQLSSPVDKTLSVLRPSIFVSLLKNLVEIFRTNQNSVAIFECGGVYTSYNIFQKNIAGIRAGRKFPENIYSKNKDGFDFYDVKADLLEALRVYEIDGGDLEFVRLDGVQQNVEIMTELRALRLVNETQNVNQHSAFFHMGKSAIVLWNKIPLAYVGELHPRIIQDYGFNTNVCGFVILMEQLNRTGKQKKKPLFESIYQAVERDFAMIFEETVMIGNIEKVIVKAAQDSGSDILRRIEFFDIYRDEKLKNENKKSVGFRMKIQSNRETLSDKKIVEFTDGVLESLRGEFNCYLSADI